MEMSRIDTRKAKLVGTRGKFIFDWVKGQDDKDVARIYAGTFSNGVIFDLEQDAGLSEGAIFQKMEAIADGRGQRIVFDGDLTIETNAEVMKRVVNKGRVHDIDLFGNVHPVAKEGQGVPALS